MEYVVVAVFDTYGAAERTELDLESAGIVGEQVEVISDPDEDVRTANTPHEAVTKAHKPRHGWMERLLHAHGNQEIVRDLPGEQPKYIGAQEYYANHLKQGGVVMIVRTPTETPANRAKEILQGHGGRTPGRKDGPTVRRID